MDIKDARVRAARLCSQQEQCSADIREKLERWEVSEKDIDTVLNWLKSEKFLDDDRYASFYVRDKFRFNRWGKIKIRFMLKQKQIPGELIDRALADIPEGEYLDTCRQLLESKLKTIKDKNQFTRKAKLLRFASQRGFESEVIYRAMERLGDER